MVRVLVVTGQLPARAGLSVLWPPGTHVEVVTVAGAAADLLPGADAVVLDGPVHGLGTRAFDGLRAVVEAGATLLALGSAPAPGTDPELAELLGVTSGAAVAPEPVEVFATVADPASPLVARTMDEFPVVDSVVLLTPADDGVVPLLTCSVGLHHHPLVTTRRRGRGRIVVSAVGTTDLALAGSELARVFRRALTPVSPPRDTTLGVGIVGYGTRGGMGDAHGLAVGATDGLELVAAVEPDQERRKAAEQAFPGIRTCPDVADLLSDGDVDVAVVATPPTSHAALALRLLRAGKHVALEKPMCLTVAEADELITTADDHAVTLTVHQNRRWDPDFLALRRAVETGQVGAVFNVETFVGGFEHPCRAWHSEERISGGAVYDWGSHHVDWILQLMGTMPARVTTTAHKRVWHDVTNHDQVRLRLDWDDGREAEFLQSDLAAVRRPKFWVQGTAGTVAGHYRPLVSERIELGRGFVREESHHAEAPVDLSVVRYESGYGLTETVVRPVPAQPFPFHRNLADHLLLGEPLAVAPRSVRAVVAVLEASQGAGMHGGPVTLPGAGAPVGP